MLRKAATGIPGVDEMLDGGFPIGRPTLVTGDSGAGKTILCLQTLFHGASSCGEPGLYLSFEERSAEMAEMVTSFDWGDTPEELHFHDALIDMDFEATDGFELTGLLALLDHMCARDGIRRLVLDGIDVLLHRIGSAEERNTELGRLQQWIRQNDRTVLITVKAKGDKGLFDEIFEALLFGSDCAVHLQRRQDHRMSQRSIWVTKYRGSQHGENAYPFVISKRGIVSLHLSADMQPGKLRDQTPVSTGVQELDDMLRGGFPAGSITLYTGGPGTAKTTLAGAFVHAACVRGERALLILFDEFPDRVVGHLRSVGIDLQPHVDSGLLRIEYAIGGSLSPDHHGASIREWITDHRPDVIAIDPLSSLMKPFGRAAIWPAVEFLLHAIRISGATAMLTSVTTGTEQETSLLHVSTIADNWIHLAYGIRGAERNRVLTIVKARGVAHSNDLREMILGSDGVSLTDVYPIDGGMLTGTTRVARMRADQAEHDLDANTVGTDVGQLTRTRMRLLDDMAQLSEQLRRIDAKSHDAGSSIDD